MDHKKYEELLQLSFLGEADEQQVEDLKNHVAGCLSCRNELEQYRKLDQYLSFKKQNSVPGSLLQEAREDLRQRLRIERNHENVFIGFFGKIYRNIKLRPGYVYSAAFSLAAGLILGYFIFSKPAENILEPVNIVNASDFTGNPADIRNVRLSDADPEDDNIELSFETVRDVKVEGSIKDEKVRNLLLYVILNGKNPGVRLNSLNAINSSLKTNEDPEVKEAIISSAKFDPNPGVRREALQVLKNFPYDQEIKKAYLYVIVNDTSSSLRIDAINQIIEAGKTGAALDQEEQKIFRDRLVKDENSYVRLRSKTILQEYL